MIYADNSATTQVDIDAFEAMKPYLLDQFSNASQPYSFARGAKAALKAARETIATCINATPEEIFFSSGGTENDNWAIKGTIEYGDCRAVITSEFEHHAILHACKRIESFGYPVAYLHPTREGFITPEILSRALTQNTRLVSIMMVNNEIGTIQPIKELCNLAHQRGALFHTDAVQAIGHIPVDVKDLDVDILSCSAHKFNGPKGVAFQYIKKGTLIMPYADGGAQEYGMRAGTENIAYIVGMAAALKKNIEIMNSNDKHLRDLEEIIVGSLSDAKIDFIRNGTAPQAPGILSLSFANAEGEMLLHRLDLMGIMVSTGSACDSQNTQISHVLQAIEAPEKYAKGTIRISLGKDNTEAEALKISTSLIKILSK